MVHRGPDDQGIWMDCLGRLGSSPTSIIDRSSGHQPMCNEDESIWITFNGRFITSRRSERNCWRMGEDTFLERGATRSSICMRIWGQGCVQRLTECLPSPFGIAGRRCSAWGSKLLYYAATSRVFAFASEIQATPQSGRDSHLPESSGLTRLFNPSLYDGSPDDGRGFKSLSLAIMIVKDGQISQKAYWVSGLQQEISRLRRGDDRGMQAASSCEHEKPSRG